MKTKPTTPPQAPPQPSGGPHKVLLRIGQQVDHLIMPDFRPLAGLLHKRLNGVARERLALLRRAEAVRNEALEAATALMLTREEDWQNRPGGYFKRIQHLRENGL